MAHDITVWFEQEESAEAIYLHQIIDIDGYDETVLATETLFNGSGRPCGRTYTISDENWELIQESIQSSEIDDETDD